MNGLIYGVFRADTASNISTGVAPVLALDANGAMYAHIVSTAPGTNAQPSGDFVITKVTVGNTSTVLLPADTTRTYFFIVNLGTATVFLNFTAAATVTDLPVIAGGFLEPLTVPTNAINGIVAAATENVYIMTL